MGKRLFTASRLPPSRSKPQPPLSELAVHVVSSAPLSVATEPPGRMSAFRVAKVRPQISGIVLQRSFTEGSAIKAGQSFYQIAPATYQAPYSGAKGDEAKAVAAAAIAHVTVKRYLPLLGTQYISRQEYDQALATVQQLNPIYVDVTESSSD